MATRLLGFLVLLWVAFPALAAEVAGVKLEDKVRVANSELALNGAGLRKRAFFQVYAIGLYLPEKTTAAGTQVTVDGKATGAPIAGEDFYRALLRVWLGDNPVQADLKKSLLGEKQ